MEDSIDFYITKGKKEDAILSYEKLFELDISTQKLL